MTLINNGLPKMRTPTPDDLTAWAKWVKKRPRAVRAMCERFQPWYYYYMPQTKQVVVLLAYSEDGTLRVQIVGDAISIPAVVSFEVFGVLPADLVDLPSSLQVH